MAGEDRPDHGLWADRIRRAMATGQLLDVSAHVSTEDAPSDAGTDGPPGDRPQTSAAIPAEAIREVLASSPAPARPFGLRLRGASITGDLELNNADFDGPLHFEDCTFDGGVDLGGSRLRELYFRNTCVRSIAIANAQITGDFAVFDGSTVTDGVHGAGMRVGGSVIAAKSTLASGDGKAIVLDGAQIDGHFSASDASITGLVSLAGAAIGGHVDLSGAAVFNPWRLAVFLDGVTVKRGLFGRRGFSAKGEVRAVSAKIGGQVDFEAAYMSNPGRVALNLEGTVVSGSVLCRGVLIEGQVRAIALNCESISLTAAVLAQADGREGALILDGARIQSDAFLDELTVTHNVRLPAARVDGQLVLLGARIYGSLVLQSARVAQMFHMPAVLTGCTDLTRAVIDDLFTPESVAPTGGLRAVGWSIGDFHGGLRTDWRLAKEWLETVPEKAESIQSWNAVATVYDQNGDVAAARRLRLSAANRVTRRAPFGTKVGRTLYLILVGHGYYPRLAGLWLIFIVAVGSILISDYRGSIVPTDAGAAAEAVERYRTANNLDVAASEITGRTPCLELAGYPCLHPVTFTLTTLLPDIATSAGSDWKIRSDAVALTNSLIVLKLFAWFLSALVIASVTGLLRKA